VENGMSFKLDYEEPIQFVVKRLSREHIELQVMIDRVIAESKNGNLPVAISLLNLFRPEILRHALDEEARLMRVIMDESR
jgi:hypothetical protein